MSVAETYERISDDELELWLAFFKLEPFGPLREELRAGQICAAVGNVLAKGSPLKPEHYFPTLSGRAPRRTAVAKTPQQLFDIVQDGIRSRQRAGGDPTRN